jgi:hypothetical protein
MATVAMIGRSARAVLAGVALLFSAATASAQVLPPEVQKIVAPLGASPAETATKDVLALNTAMFELYDNSAQIFKANLLATHPIILALFSGAGGRLILYRPGQPPIDAPQVPPVYQLLKSVGHSTMALAEVVIPYLSSANDLSWRAALLAYRSRMQSAAEEIDKTDMPVDWRANSKKILQNSVAYMDECAAKGVITLAGLQSFAKKQAPLLKRNIAWAAQTQVEHWTGVVSEWKALLGSQWQQTYAASNTIYVARQNNVLFSVLAQYFGAEAINDRLMLIETISFTTTPEDMLNALTRIIADRTVGAVFFDNYHLMDYELMGGDARKTIIAETRRRGMTAVLPPEVPFGSHQWPTLITPGPGPTSLDDLPDPAAGTR